MTWVEELHPRDEYGRFRLTGVMGKHTPSMYTGADDRTFRDAAGRVFDQRTGFKVNSRAAREGWFRVGDLPAGIAEYAPGGQARPGDASSRGAWHRSGDYHPGGVPRLVTEEGTPLSSLKPKDTRSYAHRKESGTFARAELRAERALGHRLSDRRDEYSYPGSADVFGDHLASSLNPVGRRRTLPARRKRQQRTTWIQRINAQMEGR
jgi:hypothetical protein